MKFQYTIVPAWYIVVAPIPYMWFYARVFNTLQIIDSVEDGLCCLLYSSFIFVRLDKYCTKKYVLQLLSVLSLG